MSEGIQLNEDLITDVINAIGKHDRNAQEDRIVVLQYLAAINGFLSADYPGPAAEREELPAHLDEFTRHVCNEKVNARQQQQTISPAQAQPIKGRSIPAADPAVGIWKPEQDI
ncbi:MAG: hypothetical protein OEZ39_00250 [Gammaproteobacteria bacterium]|nr:hypothetical protein [Gammaproteobacteria bacterium]MDH5650278.1 hypothetical protein [Gammaproteobacteria bacterium]